MAKIPQGEWNAIAARYAKGESISKIARTYRCTPPAIHYILKRIRQNAAKNFEHNSRPDPSRIIARQSAQIPAGSDHSRSTEPRRKAPGSRPAVPQRLSDPDAGRQSTSMTELDRELYSRVETAIDAFRSSFGGALAEVSPVTRQRLRQAASDLMRVAAQTTIVLDRLNARSEPKCPS